jgi:polyphosphate kinase 2 (PPK2 family)
VPFPGLTNPQNKIVSKKSKKNGREKMSTKEYEKELRKLQAQLCYLQDWVKEKGKRVIIVFEGRDAAGKGGTIRALTERVSPRVFRLIALPAPSDREKSQMYMQRYMAHFPAAGEIVERMVSEAEALLKDRLPKLVR